MLPELENSDWEEVFKYAQPHVCEAGHQHGPTATIMSEVDTSEFTRDDVEETIAIVNGENDEESWVGVFKLADRRYVVIRGWCDYTGWG